MCRLPLSRLYNDGMSQHFAADKNEKNWNTPRIEVLNAGNVIFFIINLLAIKATL